MKLTRLVPLLIATAWLGAAPAWALERFVSLNGAHVPPFTSWANAATNIQDAVDAAANGDVIWVTNGVYANGGRPFGVGLTTNRVLLNKAVTLRSVNGPEVTVIEGRQDNSTTNGAGSVRCAWMGNNAVLSGFTLRGGGTRSSDFAGGGVAAQSLSVVITNCVLSGNAATRGGGASSGWLRDCTILENTAVEGGGAFNSRLTSCRVIENFASGSLTNGGGGVSGGIIENSLLARNSTAGIGGGAFSTTVRNSALIGNVATINGAASASSSIYNCTLNGNRASAASFKDTLRNSIVWNNTPANVLDAAQATYICTEPLLPGTGNIAADPQLLADGIHVADSSPCRGAGNAAFSAGTDFDGDAWGSPPTMGCDEFVATLRTVGQPAIDFRTSPHDVVLSGVATGDGPISWAWFKDGEQLADGGKFSGTETDRVVIFNPDVSEAGAYQFVVSNSTSVATSLVAQVMIHCVNAASAAPQAPFTSWATAAANIQEAIDAAAESARSFWWRTVFTTRAAKR